MHVIGIIGGVASGKSLAAQIFADLGAEVLSGDQIGHEVLGDPEVTAAARDRWGETILDGAGQIDRSRLAAIVFRDGDENELRFLENLTHPHIAHRLQEAIDDLSARGVRAVVLDAAVLLKAGWDEMCDGIVFLDTPLEIRQAFALNKGWDETELARRESNQFPLDVKRSRADWILDNSGSAEKLRAEIIRFWDSQFESDLPN